LKKDFLTQLLGVKKRGFKSLPKMDMRCKPVDNSFDLEMIMDLPMKE